MAYLSNLASLLHRCLLAGLLLLAPATGLGAEAPIQIEANRMSSVEESKSVVFTGDVDARQGDVRIRADEMTVYYREAASPGAQEAEGGVKQQVDRLICIGHVEITRGEWLGTAKKLTYLSTERQVILTDNAKAWQGRNMVSGDKIIYYLDEGRSEVVGGRPSATVGGDGDKPPSSRVNMTILPN